MRQPSADRFSAFENEPTLELRRADIRAGLSAALERLDGQLPLEVPVLVDGDAGGSSGIESTDPGAPETVVATAGIAGDDEIAVAVEQVGKGQERWAALPAAQRGKMLVEAARLMRERRLELAALEVRECAKPWPEADADVCEAIDFLEYYARGAVALERGPELMQVPGEQNTMSHRPRGVVGVIAPWNFPVAIPTGMAAAALATGNGVVLKPAEQAPGCALRLIETLREAGVPAEALSLLPGFGETGASLVRQPGVSTIAFTGSSAVGLEIIQAAAKVQDEQRQVKRVVAEMGGKNCMMIDADADLDEVVPAVVCSAFAYGGQKCSACSRVLAHEAVVEELSTRLTGAVEALVVGQAERLGTDVPPLIERAAQQRVDDYRKLAGVEGRVLTRHESVPPDGWFCPPTLVADLPAASRLLRDEVFGPIVAIEAVPSIESACAEIDALPFGLTCGLFSRDPTTVAAVRANSPVGNLYINRQITGAIVGRQPFGGNRLSGIGAKAGGPEYLLQFLDASVVSENTMRHGLVT